MPKTCVTLSNIYIDFTPKLPDFNVRRYQSVDVKAALASLSLYYHHYWAMSSVVDSFCSPRWDSIPA